MRKLRVLLVDDEIIIWEGFKRLFDWDAHDCEVAGEAADGMEALSRIDTLDPDLVIMDINIPILNGLKVIQLSRIKHPDMAFIIVSGYDDFSHCREALRLQITHSIPTVQDGPDPASVWTAIPAVNADCEVHSREPFDDDEPLAALKRKVILSKELACGRWKEHFLRRLFRRFHPICARNPPAACAAGFLERKAALSGSLSICGGIPGIVARFPAREGISSRSRRSCCCSRSHCRSRTRRRSRSSKSGE